MTKSVSEIDAEARKRFGPPPGRDPVERLRHTLAVCADAEHERVAVTATRNVYRDAPWTGLTYGDLRMLLEEIDGWLAGLPEVGALVCPRCGGGDCFSGPPGCTSQRDGFVIYGPDGREVDFVPCGFDGRLRDRAIDGLLLKVDFERGYRFVDTRATGQVEATA